MRERVWCSVMAQKKMRRGGVRVKYISREYHAVGNMGARMYGQVGPPEPSREGADPTTHGCSAVPKMFHVPFAAGSSSESEYCCTPIHHANVTAAVLVHHCEVTAFRGQ